ncbi:HK97 gp10 family phage protein [Kitasatospora sp. CB01950]|uniref:HK97 gp10 family phage protein n=1 Tax=Kitasatospora sp. CB01950 TaxID=1703930 RepID=UPI000938BE21|nr:HK97 gp10 family phage protein [Kitasatospora sp. CB01950]OKJ06822.1 hypothetical protein AMK19_23525 [Kitasatospora sp. CB01950]
MGGLSYNVDSGQFQNALRDAVDRLRGESRQVMDRVANDMVNTAKSLVPVDTGRLRSSIRAIPVGGGRFTYTVTVGTNVEYASDVEYGTAPHVILPKNKKALYWKGAAHPVARVNHPGTRPYPFMRPAVLRAEELLRAHAKGVR